MTEEELKKKAEESYWDSTASGSMSSKNCYVVGYIAGAKENQLTVEEMLKRLLKGGYVKSGICDNKEDVIWHDLRKNSKDLPQKIGDYIVALDYQKGSFSTYLLQYNVDEYEDYIKLGWFDSEYTNYDDDVIAWCEIPKFEVEE